jgi:hypothetical protein
MYTSIPWIIGLVFVVPAALSVIHGRTTIRGQSGPIFRNDEAKTFWLVVGMYAVLSLLMFYVALSKYVVG